MNTKCRLVGKEQGCGVGVARSRGNEPGVEVGVGAEKAALTPTPERLPAHGRGRAQMFPHRFFADSRKMAAHSAAKFGIAVHSFFVHLV